MPNTQVKFGQVRRLNRLQPFIIVGKQDGNWLCRYPYTNATYPVSRYRLEESILVAESIKECTEKIKAIKNGQVYYDADWKCFFQVLNTPETISLDSFVSILLLSEPPRGYGKIGETQGWASTTVISSELASNV